MKNNSFRYLFMMLLLLCGAMAHAYDFAVDGIYYNITDKVAKTVEVTSGDAKYSSNVIIPESVNYNGKVYSVTSIGDEAFYECKSMTSVTIPNSITSIGRGAFYFCDYIDIVYNNSALNITKGSKEHGYVAWRAAAVITKENETEYETVGNFIFHVTKNVNTLVAYTGDATEITLPENCNGKNYVIGYNAFAFSKITSIIIPNSVTSIERSAFDQSCNLVSVIIPNSVKNIGFAAFWGCSGLTNVTIGDGVKTIEGEAFMNCRSLKSVTIGKNVTSIGNNAFYACRKLSAVHIKDLSAWCKTVFGYDTSNPLYYAKNLYLNGKLLTDLVIPNDVKEIKQNTFYNCRSLTSVTIPNSVTTIGDDAFRFCSRIKSLTIPNSVTSIGNNAFENCSGLVRVIIGDGITSMGRDIFAYCGNLTEIYSLLSTPITINSRTFDYNYQSATLYVPISAKETYQNTAYWKNFFSITEKDMAEIDNLDDIKGEISNEEPLIVVNDCVFEVPKGSLDYSNAGVDDFAKLFNVASDDIVSIEILKDAESCAIWGPYGANGVIKITIKRRDLSGVETIEPNEEKNSNEANDSNDNLFSQVKPFIIVLLFIVLLHYFPILRKSYDFETDGICYKIKNKDQRSVSVAKNKKVGILYGYSGNIVIPETVMCKGVTYTVVSVDDDAFEKCPEITTLSIPKSVIHINERQFWGYKNLNAIYIDDLTAWCNIDSATGGLFRESTRFYLKGTEVTDLVIPKGITSIREGAFDNCCSIRSVTMGDDVTTIGEDAFWYCKNLISVTIGNNVTTIGDSAFCGCENITNIVIPNSVTSIEDFAFSSCSGLTNIVIPSSVANLGESVFSSCSGLCSIVVESGNRVYDSREDCNAIIETATNTLIKGCKSTIIPDNVATIRESAFYGCDNLTNIIIPDSVTTIEEYAFCGCENLTSVIIGKGVKEIDFEVFSDCDNLVEIALLTNTPPVIKGNTFSNYSATLYVSAGAKATYQTAEYWKNFSNIVEVDIEK